MNLRLRLFLAFLFVVALAVVLMAVVANQRTITAFTNFANINAQQNFGTFAELLAQEIEEEGLDKAPRVMRRVAESQGRDVLLFKDNEVIFRVNAPSRPEGTVNRPPVAFLLTYDGEIPTVHFHTAFGNGNNRGERGFPFQGNGNNNNEDTFRGSVNTGFLLAGVVALGIAGILALAFSQRILQPIQSLTNATRQMQAGDLSQRVDIVGDDEIGKLGTTFNAMASSLQVQEQLRRNMVSDIAHELRTPLSNIRGYLEAIQDGVIDPNTPTIDSIHEEAMLLNHLIEDLQELSLAEAGQLRIDPRPIDIRDVIESAVAGLKMPASAKNISLTANLPTNLPMVQADPERIGQVLRNLIKNAIAYTENAGSITISAKELANGVEVTTTDTGKGIAPEHIPHLFDRFYRADESRNRATGGTGLGLAITKALVDMHGGKVSVDSKVGVGTTFKFSLPQV